MIKVAAERKKKKSDFPCKRKHESGGIKTFYNLVAASERDKIFSKFIFNTIL